MPSPYSYRSPSSVSTQASRFRKSLKKSRNMWSPPVMRSLVKQVAPRWIKPTGYNLPITLCQNISASITSAASTDLNIAHKIKFSDLPSYASFAALYQQYRINWFEVTFIPAANCVDRNNGTTFINVPLYYAFDPDQDNTPTTAQILAFSNLKTSQFLEGFTMRIHPVTTITGASTNEIKKKSQDCWFDTSNAGQYHSGVDIAIPYLGWASSAMVIGYVNTKICFSLRYMTALS